MTASILIVEDDGILATNLSATVIELGYTVLGPVRTGEAAVEICQNNQADLVLMDIELAGKLNGIETAASIASISDVPVVFVTGFSQEPLLKQVKAVAPYGYLVKPVAERELAATITMSLHRHALDRQLKESRIALEKSETRFRRLYEEAPLGIFRATASDLIMMMNQEMARIMGCTSVEEALSWYNTDLKQSIWVDHGERQAFISQLKNHGELRQFECRKIKKNGEIIWLSMDARLSPPTEADGDNHDQVIEGFATDITQRKWMEEQLALANENLERRVEQRTQELQETQKQYLHAEKLTAIGRLSASIAHEFNNPLQGILSILKGLRKRAVLEEEDRQLLEAAIVEGDRIKDLIRHLQDFNRPSSGKKVVMDVHQSLNAILLLYKSDFKNKRISVVLDYADQLPEILAVPDQIKQVFLNLLTNAADACQQPGCVITLLTWQENDRVAVAFHDNGIGIKDEAMEQLFQPFYTTKEEVKGTGLGLPVSYGIIQRHNGEIRVTSQPETGTTFTILLPIRDDSVVSYSRNA
ncbi:ATP-binding response regulator [Desulfobulbus alkaliphilus]|uniref:ATP-binding response regulator n=1 Tax=Desulfobulbus alkaliphilus TaxID=869814 RepID=UPI0019628323|nr:ATP-binding protein [Desulfobulbus alkaliphilus]MBM9538498.1 response regulator [Desulfobulbus alkaliphilus]